MAMRERQRSLAVSMASLAFLAVMFMLSAERRGVSSSAAPPMPTFVTLHYRTPWDAPIIEHNCVLGRRAGARMIVHTEDLHSRYCRACTCVRFIPVNCPAPDPRPRAVNHCEKLAFMQRILPAMGELAYLDADLLVVRQSFFSMLAARARVHDFLATYGSGAFWEKHKYRTTFNSGLVFIREIPNTNYSDFLPYMYRIRTGYDQSVMSHFVHKYYDNWDTLSWKWHCRGMLRNEWDIPPMDCFTIHDRGELKNLIPRLNFSYLKA